MSRLPILIDRLSLQEQSPSVFVGGAGEGGVGAESRLVGGMVAAQAAMSACDSAESKRPETSPSILSNEPRLVTAVAIRLSTPQAPPSPQGALPGGREMAEAMSAPMG